MKKILMISTGGTIACASSEHGLIPSLDGQKLLDRIKEELPVCEIHQKNLMNVDSSDMQPAMMMQIAREIYKAYPHYDGFVVTHGTDTMAYSASMVTYLLKGLHKPVVFTGSQLPIMQEGTDARENLMTAFRHVLKGESGLVIAFCGKIINAVRASKLDSKEFDAFFSINANLPEAIEDKGELSLVENICDKVALVKIFPGMKADIFDYYKDRGYRGVIIEGYGAGNVPQSQVKIADKLIELCKEGIAVVLTSQCLYGGTELGLYGVSESVTNYEIIDGLDMTTEALCMKLMVALGQYEQLADIREYMHTPVQGDCLIK